MLRTDWVMCLLLNQEMMGYFDSSQRTVFNVDGWVGTGPCIKMKVLVADEEERTPARQNSAEVHCRGYPGDGQGAMGSWAAILGAGIVTAGSPHL